MGTFKVNGNIEATGTISASSFLGNASSATTSSYPAGFGARLTSSTWGAISSASYTCFSEWNAGSASDKGGIAFMGYPSQSQVSVKIDGFFYQNEGNYRCLDTSGGTLTGTLTNSAQYPLRFSYWGNNNAYIALDTNGLYLAAYGSSNSGKKVHLETYDAGIFHRKNGTDYEILTAANYSQWALPISGGTIQSTAANTLSINTTNASINYIRLANNNSNKVTLGYYLGLAFIANEVGNYARIGVNDSGIPQYWTTNTTSGGVYTLLHSGNIGSHTSGYSTLWALTGTANTTTGHSDWDGAVGNTNKYTVYDQKWACSRIGSDTGDLRVFVRPGEYTSGGTEVCFAIDGDFYVMGHKVQVTAGYGSTLPSSGLRGEVFYKT